MKFKSGKYIEKQITSSYTIKWLFWFGSLEKKHCSGSMKNNRCSKMSVEARLRINFKQYSALVTSPGKSFLIKLLMKIKDFLCFRNYTSKSGQHYLRFLPAALRIGGSLSSESFCFISRKKIFVFALRIRLEKKYKLILKN